MDEFLSLKPKRLDFEWTTNDKGIVSLKVTKFNSNLGKFFCKLIGKDNFFISNFDKIGSLIWINCDGKKTVKDILDIVKKKYPDEKDLDQRLILFLQQLQSLKYIEY